MKGFWKKLSLIGLLFCLSLGLGIFAACGESTEPPEDPGTDSGNPPTGKVTYTTTVLYPNNAPVSGEVMVQWCQVTDEGEIGICYEVQTVNEEGVATIELDPQNCVVHLLFPDTFGGYYYDESAYSVTAENRDITVKLVEVQAIISGKGTGEFSTDLQGYTKHTANPYRIPKEGTVKVKVTAKLKEVYYSFEPTVSGIYTLTSLAANYDTTIKQYTYSNSGVISNDVLQSDDDSGEGKNFSLSFEVKDGEVGNSYLFVVSVKTETYPVTFLMQVKRTGDATPSDIVPATMLTPEATLADYKEPDYGSELEAVDWYNPVTAVYNDADGFYHLGSKDGAVIVLKITSVGNYLDKSIAEICTLDGGFPVVYTADDEKVDYRGFFLDSVGNVENESDYRPYTYTEYCNSDGVYGVTQELKTALELIAAQTGEKQAWFGGNGINPIFTLKGTVPEENRWLFACFTYTEGLPTDTPASGSGAQADPYVVPTGAYQVKLAIEAKQYYQLDSSLIYDVTVSATDKNVRLLVDGTTEPYGGDDGFSVTLSAGDKFSVYTKNGLAGDFVIEVRYLAGTAGNPYGLEVGENELTLFEDSSVEAYHTFTAPATYGYTFTTTDSSTVLKIYDGSSLIDTLEGAVSKVVSLTAEKTYTIIASSSEKTDTALPLIIQDWDNYSSGDGSETNAYTVKAAGTYRAAPGEETSVYVKFSHEGTYGETVEYIIKTDDPNARLSVKTDTGYEQVESTADGFSYTFSFSGTGSITFCLSFIDTDEGGYSYTIEQVEE